MLSFLFLEVKRLLLFFFFFSSRRRHTRLQGDWSSDVCSSDLRLAFRRRLDETEQPEPSRVGECLQHPGQTFGVRALNRLAAKRRDGRQRSFGQRCSHVFHPSTNSIDSPAYPQVRIGNFFRPRGRGRSANRRICSPAPPT